MKIIISGNDNLAVLKIWFFLSKATKGGTIYLANGEKIGSTDCFLNMPKKCFNAKKIESHRTPFRNKLD